MANDVVYSDETNGSLQRLNSPLENHLHWVGMLYIKVVIIIPYKYRIAQ